MAVSTPKTKYKNLILFLYVFIFLHTGVCVSLSVCLYVYMNILKFWGNSLVFWLCLMLVTTAEMKASEVQAGFLACSLQQTLMLQYRDTKKCW